MAGTSGRRARGVEALPLNAPNETYRFVAPRRGRAFMHGLMVAAVVCTVLSAVMLARDPSLPWIVAAVVGAVVAVSIWAAMLARVPQTVTLKNSVIEIRSNGHSERFDLADPTVEVLARDGEMALRCYDGRFAIVHSRDVDWKLFTHVVMHYQNHADRKAEERAARFSR